MADERDEIRARINIVHLVGQRVRLTKAGKDWKGLCPFHDDKRPSFTVSEKYGSYNCWSCGEKGDIFSWVMKTQHVEFAEALQILADEAGVTLSRKGPGLDKNLRSTLRNAMEEAQAFFVDQLARSESAKAYLEGRSLGEEVRKQWELGYAPDVGDALASHLKKRGFQLAECKSLFLVDEDASGGYFDKFRGRLMFPIRDVGGELVAFGGRLLGDGVPKYINSSDTPLYKKSRVLYGMHRAKEAMNATAKAVLCEGYLDVIACHAAGVGNAVASLGTALSEDHAKLLGRWCQGVTILYDADSAGMKAADRAIDILLAEGLACRVALMPAGDDPDTLLRRSGAPAVVEAVASGVRPSEYRIERLLASGDPSLESFWTDVYEILARESSELEIVRHVERLAGLHPAGAGVIQTQNAMRRQIDRLRRRGGAARRTEIVAGAAPVRVARKMHSAEATLFAGLLEDTTKAHARRLVEQVANWQTPLAAELAVAVKKIDTDAAPSVWLHSLESEEFVDAFAALGRDPRHARLTAKVLDDAASVLAMQAEQALVATVKETDGTGAALSRLKALKPRYEKPVDAEI